MEETTKTINIKIVTPMLSHGIDREKAEFRITELKAAMRFWWRAARSFDLEFNMRDKAALLKKLRSEEEKLFGSKEKISPIMFRKKGESVEYEKETIQVNGKRLRISGIKEGEIELSVFMQENEDIYMEIMNLASYLGGLGQRSRKGYGAFTINNKEYVNSKALADNISKCLKTTARECKCEKGNPFYVIERKEEKLFGNYAFIKEIRIGEAVTRKDFLEKTVPTLQERKQNFGRGRTVSPVYISCYPSKDNKVFPVVTFLNETTAIKQKNRTGYRKTEDTIKRK